MRFYDGNCELPYSNVMLQRSKKLPYRLGVGLLIQNQHGKIFVGKRRYRDRYWHMPQGGIEPNETDEQAVFREMLEEIGSTNAKIISSAKENFKYDVPIALIPKLWNGQYRGQSQKWFLIHFMGENSEIDIKYHHKPEFVNWRWFAKKQLIREVPPFKRSLYSQVMSSLQI